MTERITTPPEFDTSDGPQSQPAPAPAYMSDLEAEPELTGGAAAVAQPSFDEQEWHRDGCPTLESLHPRYVTQKERIRELDYALQTARTELGRMRKAKANGEVPWRTGRKVRRTIYDRDDALIGVLDTAELAARVVEAVNGSQLGEARQLVVESTEKLLRAAERLVELEKLVDDLGEDPNPNPDTETPEQAIKRHHAKAWEWATIADTVARDLAVLNARIAEAIDLAERGALAGQILEALRGK